MYPITSRVPSNAVMVGANGISSASIIQQLVNGCISRNLRGIMIWYGSVTNGPMYGAGADTSKDVASQNAFASALAYFKSVSG